MACPFLTEVTMVFCTACKVRKPIPNNGVSTASACGGSYRSCPIYVAALSLMEQGSREQELNQDPAAPTGEPS
jgi:hypothetical protein